MNEKKKRNTCANSRSPEVSVDHDIAEVVKRECDIEDSVDAPYENLAKYRMVTEDDDDSTFSASRS